MSEKDTKRVEGRTKIYPIYLKHVKEQEKESIERKKNAQKEEAREK